MPFFFFDIDPLEDNQSSKIAVDRNIISPCGKTSSENFTESLIDTFNSIVTPLGLSMWMCVLVHKSSTSLVSQSSYCTDNKFTEQG